jgi:hypothetical protein
MHHVPLFSQRPLSGVKFPLMRGNLTPDNAILTRLRADQDNALITDALLLTPVVAPEHATGGMIVSGRVAMGALAEPA